MCSACQLVVDSGNTTDFAERMLEILNHGALALMTSIGYRTGLFDVMAELPPSTSEAIAEASGLDHRYVREWLGAMVTGGLIDHAPTCDTYRLPPEHAACLTRGATPNNLAAFAQYIPLLAGVEDRIIDCFRQGGGVPYAAYPRFQEVMADDSGQTVVPALTDHILPLVPGFTRRLEQGIEVLDIGCGSGQALATMARAYPNSRFRGYDISKEGIARGRALAAADGLGNLEFEVVDAAFMADVARFDLITTFNSLHDQARPDIVLRGIRRALRPGGVYLMQDVAGSSHLHKNLDHPMGPFLYTVSCMHCMTVSLAAGGMGLGAMWGEDKAKGMLAEAGFAEVTVHRLDHDIHSAYFVCRRD